MCTGFGPNKDYRIRLLRTLRNMLESYNSQNKIIYINYDNFLIKQNLREDFRKRFDAQTTLKINDNLKIQLSSFNDNNFTTRYKKYMDNETFYYYLKENEIFSKRLNLYDLMFYTKKYFDTKEDDIVKIENKLKTINTVESTLP